MTTAPAPTARAYAHAIVTSDQLAVKLAPPPDNLELEDSGPPLVLMAPGRPANLAIAHARSVRTPPVAGMRDPAQRARIVHALANHELQAIELFAWALLAYPSAPLAFRRGLVAILADEQRHCALYIERLAALGGGFGDHPVTGHFWNKLDHLATPLDFVCAMGLTFENANLDFAGDYAEAARACGDTATAAVLDQVHTDEIGHVHFGWIWLRRFAGDMDPWQAYLSHVRFPLGPRRARGARFDREARRRAGLDETFIAALEATAPTRPSGEPRCHEAPTALPKLTQDEVRAVLERSRRATIGEIVEGDATSYDRVMASAELPPHVIERIVEVLAPEEVWLFGSRARHTHGPDSDWDLMAIVPDSAPESVLDLARVWHELRDLRRQRVEVIPMRRSAFEEDRHTLGELAEAVAREGHVVYGR